MGSTVDSFTVDGTIGLNAPKSTLKRDALREIEKNAQEYWYSNAIFEADAPSPNDKYIPEKYMATFPYPYMNGRLHLGHSFTLSKPEFAVGFERMRGKRTLYPLGFHCTGMPIKACADKLKREMELYGNPPVFPSDVVSEGDANRKQHSKVVAKSGKSKFQWQIMQQIGLSNEEIAKFADSSYWLEYFPPGAMSDVKSFGLKIDWRRSFITTDVNRYYDSFIRWQFNRLHDQNKIRFGKRHTIYSPVDKQACMDHDRQSGEGIGPQEYTLIKLLIVSMDFYTKFPVLSDRQVFLGAATLRPETMYGQTNCWIGPDVSYGAFELVDGAVVVMTDRAARNLSFQGFSKKEGIVDKILSLMGADLIGLQLRPPKSHYYPLIYTLPMVTVSAVKGTGIVTSVPSDSPDDFAALRDLKEKPAFRQKFGIPDEAVLPFEPKPVIYTDTYGEMTAPLLVAQLGIRSQNDRDLLIKAKELAYTEGFYKGKMIVGEYAGRSVQEAKVLIRHDLIACNEAIPYFEPEGLVVSRSGDECVVALTDQWYLAYGEEEWKAQALKCLERMNLYHEETRHQFEKTLDWLNQWACSRSFGLGSRLPWDNQYLIESLSDSTIYMAYYTVAHILHPGSFHGNDVPQASLLVTPEQMTDAVWDYVFGHLSLPPSSTDIPVQVLDRMKREFEYFYPVDLRVSGKDLISNHLTFYIYNHVALFPEKYWPKSIRANGHLLLNNEKMSKSTGNFMTLHEAVEEYTADATRLALADAGDDIDDANFVTSTCNATILNLYNLLTFIQECMDGTIQFRQPAVASGRSVQRPFNDLVFECEINQIIQRCYKAYDQMLFREVVVQGFHELQKARDRYREITKGAEGMDRDLIFHFIRTITLIMSPIIPHFCEHVWRNILNEDSSVTNQQWPSVGDLTTGDNQSMHSGSILAAKNYISNLLHEIRIAHQAETHPKKGLPPTESPNSVEIYVALSFPDWQQKSVEILKKYYSKEANSFPPNLSSNILEDVKDDPVLKEHSKKVMPFIMELGKKVASEGPESLFDRTLPFDETKIIESNMDYICKTLELTKITVVEMDGSQPSSDSHVPSSKKSPSSAIPGEPKFRFYRT